MAIPTRNASPASVLSPTRTFFCTTKTSMSKQLLQSERNALLLVDVLRSFATVPGVELHDFVIMPDHLHILFTLHEGTTVEKAMQLVKGRFSYRLKKEFGFIGEVWQRGFSDVKIKDRTSFEAHVEYIANNPVKAGLVALPSDYPFCFQSLAQKKAITKEQGLKPEPVLS